MSSIDALPSDNDQAEPSARSGDQACGQGRFPAVSLVLPCYNEVHEISQSLDSILSQVPPDDGFELIVADGMSTDGTRDILERYQSQGHLRVVDNPARYASAGLNLGIQLARAPVIIRLDAHTRYAPDYVCQCLAVLTETQAANVGGPWVAEGRSSFGQAVAIAFRSRFGFGGAKSHDPEYEGPVDTVYLGCWQREALMRAGMFDEEMTRVEDDELNLRLNKMGAVVWQSPRIRSWYRPRDNVRDFFRQYLQYGYWKVKVVMKHRLPAATRHIVPSVFLCTLLILAMGAPWSAAMRMAAIGLVAMYVGFILAISLGCAGLATGRQLVLLPGVFACAHFGYGFGFLVGLFDFAWLRRSPRRYFCQLTR